MGKNELSVRNSWKSHLKVCKFMKKLLEIGTDIKYILTKYQVQTQTLFRSKKRTNFRWKVTRYYSPEIFLSLKRSWVWIWNLERMYFISIAMSSNFFHDITKVLDMIFMSFQHCRRVNSSSGGLWGLPFVSSAGGNRWESRIWWKVWKGGGQAPWKRWDKGGLYRFGPLRSVTHYSYAQLIEYGEQVLESMRPKCELAKKSIPLVGDMSLGVPSLEGRGRP